MNWINILSQLFQIVIFPILGAGAVYVCYLIKVKTNELKQKTDNELHKKYVNMLEETIIDCVLTVNQTYVESLKQSGSFDENAQKVAFKKCYDNVMKILTDDAKEYLSSAVGDLTAYINNKIEATVNSVK